jgi:hypothetical protein
MSWATAAWTMDVEVLTTEAEAGLDVGLAITEASCVD